MSLFSVIDALKYALTMYFALIVIAEGPLTLLFQIRNQLECESFLDQLVLFAHTSLRWFEMAFDSAKNIR